MVNYQTVIGYYCSTSRTAEVFSLIIWMLVGLIFDTAVDNSFDNNFWRHGQTDFNSKHEQWFMNELVGIIQLEDFVIHNYVIQNNIRLQERKKRKLG